MNPAAAHIGGMVGGLLLGALIAKAAPDGEDFGRRFGVLGLGAVAVDELIFVDR